MSDDMGMAEEAINDALVEAKYRGGRLMTPEELKEFREWCKVYEMPANSWTVKALEHIDQQDAKIAALEAEVKRLSEPNACDDWGNPVVLGCAGGSNDKL